MQVYRRLDIGTAKPDKQLRAALPHHLIDLVEPWEHFDVGRFVNEAEQAIEAALARGNLPVLVGGTGYYFKHFLYGLPQAPTASAAIRNQLQMRLEVEGIDVLREELRRVDPESAARIDANDAYRIQRALEVYEQSGRPLSSFARLREMRRDLSVTVIELTRERAALHERISARVESMFGAGLREEIEGLFAIGAGPTWPSMRAIGYREFFGGSGELRPASEDASIAERIKTASRRYAKRQITFFQQLPTRVQIPAESTQELEATIDRELALLDRL